MFLWENILAGLWWKLLEFSYAEKPEYQSSYTSTKLLSLKPLRIVTFLKSKMCNYLMIDLSKFLSNFPHDMTEKTEETE